MRSSAGKAAGRGQATAGELTFGQAAGAFNLSNSVRLGEAMEQVAINELGQELPKLLRVFLSDKSLRWIPLCRLRLGESESINGGGLSRTATITV